MTGGALDAMLAAATVRASVEGGSMSEENETGPVTESQAFVDQLEKTGFFNQITELEMNLKKIAEDLSLLGNATVQRVDEIESLVAHVLAIESILSVMLKANPVDAEAVRATIKDTTPTSEENPDGNPKIQGAADRILKNAEG